MSKYHHASLLCPTERVSEEQRETDRKILAFDNAVRHINRRGFLGAMLSAAAIAGVAGSRDVFGQTSTVPTVIDVLNFALNLEYLEANFYLYASTGAGLASTLNGSGVPVQGAPGVLPLDTNVLALCKALVQDEVNHIADLRSAVTSLGGTPIPQPLINLAANGAITTQAQFLAAARQFTALGSSAYAGSAQLLVSNPAVLTTASQILAAEGQHAGAVNYFCVTQGVNSPALDAQDVPPSQAAFFTVDSAHALSPVRTPQQVLGVAYNVSTPATTTPPAGTTLGGFFPNGFNGNVKST